MKETTAQTLFREYILLRARMVMYAAVLLVILGTLGLAALVASSAENINRFGLALQLLGILALTPDVIGKDRVRAMVSPERTQTPSGLAVVEVPQAQTAYEAIFAFYQDHNRSIVLGNIITSIALMGVLAANLTRQPLAWLPPEILLRTVLAFVGFYWLNLFMLIHAFLLYSSRAPSGLLAWFFAVDLVVAVIGVIFSGVIYILSTWLPRWFRWVYSLGIENTTRRVLLIVTLPCLGLGLVFEILATYL